jgi:hypothetical protein
LQRQSVADRGTFRDGHSKRHGQLELSGYGASPKAGSVAKCKRDYVVPSPAARPGLMSAHAALIALDPNMRDERIVSRVARYRL